jgi:hypothetical protein
MNKKHARIAVLATKVGMPVPQFLDLVRKLRGIKCPYCQLATKILRHIDQIGEDKAIELIEQIITAKKANDETWLAELTKQFNGNLST